MTKQPGDKHITHSILLPSHISDHKAHPAMSFGVSLSDIITCGKLAHEIHYRCFTKAQGAGTLEHSPLPFFGNHPIFRLRYVFLFYLSSLTSHSTSLTRRDNLCHRPKVHSIRQRYQRPWGQPRALGDHHTKC